MKLWTPTVPGPGSYWTNHVTGSVGNIRLWRPEQQLTAQDIARIRAARARLDPGPLA